MLLIIDLALESQGFSLAPASESLRAREIAVPRPSVERIAPFSLVCRLFLEHCAPTLYQRVVVDIARVSEFRGNVESRAFRYIPQYAEILVIRGRKSLQSALTLLALLPHARIVHCPLGTRLQDPSPPTQGANHTPFAPMSDLEIISQIEGLFVEDHKFFASGDLLRLLGNWSALQIVQLTQIGRAHV